MIKVTQKDTGFRGLINRSQIMAVYETGDDVEVKTTYGPLVVCESFDQIQAQFDEAIKQEG